MSLPAPWVEMTPIERAIYAMNIAAPGVWRDALSRLANRRTVEALFEPIGPSFKCWCCTIENSPENTKCWVCYAERVEPKWR